MDLKEILDLVEKAEAGSRELDFHVAIATGAKKGHWRSLAGKTGDIHSVVWPNGDEGFAPAYTTSLDAIVGLVDQEFSPEGLVWARGRLTGGGPFYAAKLHKDARGTFLISEAEHQDGILALCAAYLRAKLAQGE